LTLTKGQLAALNWLLAHPAEGVYERSELIEHASLNIPEYDSLIYELAEREAVEIIECDDGIFADGFHLADGFSQVANKLIHDSSFSTWIKRGLKTAFFAIFLASWNYSTNFIGDLVTSGIQFLFSRSK